MIYYILILIAFYGLYKIVVEIKEQQRCPSDRELKRVVLGLTKKDSAIANRIIMHLGICEKCQERAKEIGSE